MRNLIPVLMLIMSIPAISFMQNNTFQSIWLEPRDVILYGPEKQKAFEQLKAAVKGKLTLAMDNNGVVTYTQNKDKKGRLVKMNRKAGRLSTAIDDHTVKVCVHASNNRLASNDSLLVGGAFMGNEVTGKMITTKGEPSKVPLVETKQEVNVNDLAEIDKYYENPGADMLHEVIESYIAGKVSQKSGIPAPPKKGPEYDYAHKASTKESGKLYYRILQFDKLTSELLVDTTQEYYVDFYVKKNGKAEIVIRRLTKK